MIKILVCPLGICVHIISFFAKPMLLHTGITDTGYNNMFASVWVSRERAVVLCFPWASSTTASIIYTSSVTWHHVCALGRRTYWLLSREDRYYRGMCVVSGFSEWIRCHTRKKRKYIVAFFLQLRNNNLAWLLIIVIMTPGWSRWMVLTSLTVFCTCAFFSCSFF